MSPGQKKQRVLLETRIWLFLLKEVEAWAQYYHFLFHLTPNSVTTDRVAHTVSYEEAKFTADHKS